MNDPPHHDAGSSLNAVHTTDRINHVIFFSVVAAVGGFLFGFDSAVINGTVEAIQAAFHSSSIGSGFSVASMLLGCATGALASGTIADRIGRRPVLLISAVIFFISALGSGWSKTSPEFVIYRLIGGVAVGAASVVAPAYIAEISPAKLRGRLTSLQQLAIVLGIFVAFFSNFAIAAASGGAKNIWLLGQPAWSWMYWAECVPCVLYFFLLMAVPESPRFLAAQRRDDEARQVLSRLATPTEAQSLLDSIRQSFTEHKQPNLHDLLDPKTHRLRGVVWIGILLAALQQLSGINVIFYYGATLWQAAGFSENNSLLINVISGVINIASTFLAMALIDKIGRRPLLLWGAAAMTVCLSTVAFTFAASTNNAAGHITLTMNQAVIALVAAHAFILAFGSTWGPCAWVVLSEMFSNQIRGSAMALATFALWMANFAITMSFPWLLKTFGLGNAYFVFSLFAAISFFFVLKCIRETGGHALEASTG
ncbi:MAG: sugar porter family MFS transporter [Pirellulales bacterium]|nr:sugar porter family MFS transporter [Pirellulales bacterium]